jgi:hypothetical protein
MASPPSSRPSATKRTFAIAGVVVALCALVTLYVVWLVSSPPLVAGTAGAGGRPAQLTLQTVAAVGPRYPNEDWVSYLVKDPRRGWIHSTNLEAPAHSAVQVTIHQYDTATGLRNPYFARVQGTTGGAMRLDGRTVEVISPDSASHTFAIPQLGVYVPLPGVADNASNQCAAAPCTAGEAHRTITFTFRTQGPGRFRWQCFVPCGAGFVTGFGGPMQTFGYMDGFLTVV